MANRVEDLEEEVADLRARINGLLSELTDTKTRVRDLEQQLDKQTPDDTDPKLNSETGQIEDASENNNDDDDDDTNTDSDVIVA